MMKKRSLQLRCLLCLFAGVLAVDSFAQPYETLREGDPGVNIGKASRYWDGCKASCSFLRKSSPLIGACKNCDENNNEIPVVDTEVDNNACQMRHGGAPFAYTCWDMAPFVDPNNPKIAYAFAATSGKDGDQCGTCYQLQFVGERGDGYATIATHAALTDKILVVMASNIGYDVDPGQFDLLVPGGGVGQFDSFSGQLGISKQQLGNEWGGFLNDCEDALQQKYGGMWHVPPASVLVEEFRNCHSATCNLIFGDPKHKLLLDGCLFYSDWMMAANNPKVLSKKLDKCPDILLDRYVEGSGGSNPVPGAGYTSQPRKIIVTIQANRGDGNMTSFSQGNPQTYNIENIPADGEYTMTFGLASGQAINFTVDVNGQNAGNVSLPNGTGSWSAVSPITLDSKVNLKAGGNTITMNYQTGGNITYIRLISASSEVSVRFNSAKVNKTRSNVVLRPSNKGFSAILPNSHKFESYSLVDLLGREIRKGKLQSGAAELHFHNVRQGVTFLRLKGKSGTTVLRATTF